VSRRHCRITKERLKLYKPGTGTGVQRRYGLEIGLEFEDLECEINDGGIKMNECVQWHNTPPQRMEMMTPGHQQWMGQRKKGVGVKGREWSKCQNVRVWLGVTAV